MKKNLPLLTLVIVVALVIVGYLGITSLTTEKTPPVGRNAVIPPANDENSSAKQTVYLENGANASAQNIKEPDVPEVNPGAGEKMIWGEIKAVDVEKRVLTIDQQMDDNSVKISPNVPVGKEAIIRTPQEVKGLAQIAPGDSAGIIITKEGQARAVLVNY